MIRKTGTSTEFESNNFPWTYAYAKHLSERLIIGLFDQHKASEKLLITRPSVICPAISQPYPGFSALFSIPSTGASAMVLLNAGRHMKFACRSQTPETEVTIDEIPVDIVVDRLLSHQALGTLGCVHAVSGKVGRSSFSDWWTAAMKERRLPWDIKQVWTSLNWHFRKLHPVGQLFVIFGISFDFRDGQTTKRLEKLSGHDKVHLRLYLDDPKPHTLDDRRESIREVAMHDAKIKHLPAFLVKCLCRPGVGATQAPTRSWRNILCL